LMRLVDTIVAERKDGVKRRPTERVRS
jgi:hypothetical protein